MKKQLTQLRDIEEIEEQIKKARSGVLCIHLAIEKLMQFGCNFIYLDKNIYTYLDTTDENYVHIKYGSLGSFTILSEEKVNAKSAGLTYKLSYITINGEIKEVDDVKLAEQIKELYRSKYSASEKAENYKIDENLIP
ncbi:MAG: hypothetical protein OZ915_05915, partial [Ignavibacteriales bacterium]|nr:hypothetical protein [Ignavibacteriales bacterium]